MKKRNLSEIASAGRRVYRFEGREVDSAQQGLLVDGVVQPLRQKTFQVLLHLLDHRDRVVSRDELRDQLWPETVVTDGAVGQSIVELRKALGDDSREPRFIRTFSKSGYRFICPVEEGSPGVAAVTTAPAVDFVTRVTEQTSVEVELEEDVPEPPAGLPPASRARPAAWIAAGGLALLLTAAAAVVSVAVVLRQVGPGDAASGVDGGRARRPSPQLTLPRSPGRTAVAVLHFENRSRTPELAWLREGLADMVIADLSRSRKLDVLSRQQLGLLLAKLGHEADDEVDLPTAMAVAHRSGASAFILGGFQKLGERVRVDLHLHEAGTGRLVSSESSVAERPEQILTQVDLIATKLAGRLGADLAGEEPRRNLGEVRTASLDAYRYYSVALEKARSLHVDEAISLLSKAIDLDPDFAMAHARIGYALAVTGNDSARAKPHLDRALQLGHRLTATDRRQVEAWDAICRLDFETAIVLYRRLLDDYPGETEPYIRLGKLLSGESRFDEAIDILRRGLAVDPEEGSLHNLLSQVYSDQGRHDEAIDEARRYVSLEPREPNAHDTLAAAYQWAGRYEEAFASYDRALTLNPEFTIALIHTANLQAELGRFREARATYERYRSLERSESPRARGLDGMLFAEMRRGNLDEARRLSREADANGQGWIVSSFNLALLDRDLPRADRLSPWLKTPKNPDRGSRVTVRSFLACRGRLALRKGRVEEGLSLLKQALKERPLRWYLEPFETCLADAYLELRRPPEAIAEYERVLKINPRYPMALYGLGVALQEAGRREEGSRRLREFLDVWKGADPESPELVDARRRLQAVL